MTTDLERELLRVREPDGTLRELREGERVEWTFLGPVVVEDFPDAEYRERWERNRWLLEGPK